MREMYLEIERRRCRYREDLRIVDNFFRGKMFVIFLFNIFSKMFYFIFIQSKDYCILSIVLLNLLIEKLRRVFFDFRSAKKLYRRDRRMFKLFRKLVSP